MNNHLSIAIEKNYCQTPAIALDSSETAGLLADLRIACIAARKVLCESVLNNQLDEAGAADAINTINTALVRSSCLD